jgi:DNA gyrase subunit B
MERRGIDSRLVEATALGARLSPGEAYATPEERAAVEHGISAFLESVYPAALPLAVEWAEDEEHRRWTPTLRALGAPVERRVVLDTRLLESPDYERFLALGERTRGVGETPFRVTVGELTGSAPNARQLLEQLLELGGRGQYVQRYKGLGEMNPDQLADTTLDAEKRTLLQVRIPDAVEADEAFTTLMGDDVEPRREFIERNALDVHNLDV